MPSPYDPEYYRTHDREKHKEYYRKNREKIRAKCHETYLKKRDVYLDRCKERRRRNSEYAKDWIKCHPCVDCGESDVDVLQFDHVRGKLGSISQLVSAQVTLEKLQAEIDKCEIRCANCHLRVTKQRKRDGLPPALIPSDIDSPFLRQTRQAYKRNRKRYNARRDSKRENSTS